VYQHPFWDRVKSLDDVPILAIGIGRKWLRESVGDCVRIGPKGSFSRKWGVVSGDISYTMDRSSVPLPPYVRVMGKFESGGKSASAGFFNQWPFVRGEWVYEKEIGLGFGFGVAAGAMLSPRAVPAAERFQLPLKIARGVAGLSRSVGGVKTGNDWYSSATFRYGPLPSRVAKGDVQWGFFVNVAAGGILMQRGDGTESRRPCHVASIGLDFGLKGVIGVSLQYPISSSNAGGPFMMAQIGRL
jgi:hypothetical protein